MIHSMTGFGRAMGQAAGQDITVEIRAVNHRYLDCTCKLPRSHSFLEERIKALASARLSRGKVEISLIARSGVAENAAVALNRPLLESYLAALTAIHNDFQLPLNLDALAAARFPEVLALQKEEADEQTVWVGIEPVVNAALDQFVSMRAVEGERLRADLLTRADMVLSYLAIIEQAAPRMEEEYAARLRQKIEDALNTVQIDESRLLTEVAVFCDRVSIAEEITRVKSHMGQYRSMLNEAAPVGRKLDFLLQELNREVNTIGSKCQSLDIARTVVDLKAEFEKIREQIQNIE